MLPLETVRTLVEAPPRRVVITTHQNPDADALGSSLAWAGYLRKKGHTVTVITPTDYPRYLTWMPGNADVVVFSERARARAAQVVADAEVIYCLDFNALARIGDLEPMVRRATVPKVMIDHHLQPEGFADVVFSDPTAAATAQMVYELITELGDSAIIDTGIGECLYAGFMTDTGSFRHPSTNAAVHRIAANLIELGVNTNRVHRLIFDHVSLDRLRFLGYVLSEKMVVLPEYRVAYIAVTDAELKQFHSQTGDTEGVVNYALSVENVVMAAILVDRGTEVKISFRSVGDFSVNDLARRYFNGGGHRNAAGGKTNQSLNETVERFLSVLPEFKEKLLATE
jgi:phosphoesterase RecJ-like protein